MTGFVRIALGMVAAYLGVGLLFAGAFQFLGLRVLDPAARGAGLGFRLLITPGIIALWPWVGLRWMRSAQGGAFPGIEHGIHSPRRLRSAHGLLWKALAVVVPIGIAAAIWYRPVANPSPRPGAAIPQMDNPPGLNPSR